MAVLYNLWRVFVCKGLPRWKSYTKSIKTQQNLWLQLKSTPDSVDFIPDGQNYTF